ncbi:hypothetical protein AOLI_G00211660 [Acnodon oligacanthus]
MLCAGRRLGAYLRLPRSVRQGLRIGLILGLIPVILPKRRAENQNPVSVHSRNASQPRTDHCLSNPKRYQSRCPNLLYVDTTRHHRLLNAGLGLLWRTPELRIQEPRTSRKQIAASQEQKPCPNHPLPGGRLQDPGR